MASLINILFAVLDPLHIVRRYFLKPVLDIAMVAFTEYKEKTKSSARNAQNLLLRFGILLLASIVILWSAIFMYITFYYAYMPAIAHIRPVYMQFK
jgi:hypothetical protein